MTDSVTWSTRHLVLRLDNSFEMALIHSLCNDLEKNLGIRGYFGRLVSTCFQNRLIAEDGWKWLLSKYHSVNNDNNVSLVLNSYIEKGRIPNDKDFIKLIKNKYDFNVPEFYGLFQTTDRWINTIIFCYIKFQLKD